jgi:hypothetical protein
MAQGIEVIVHGVKELEASFIKTAGTVDPVVGKALRELAKPVQSSAQELSVVNVSQIQEGAKDWSRMKIGRKRTMVYVAERQKTTGLGTPRPNLLPLMMDRALRPALQQHKGAIDAGVALQIELMLRREF